jgi:(5-formylfuran-3-yl)methyl phosphate synthase
VELTMQANSVTVSGLLVSVRSIPEAAAALDGGADVIDIKEPSRGSLGRADFETIRMIVEFVGQRRPVSAALGELTEPVSDLPADLSFVKWGLAGMAGRTGWRKQLASLLIRNRETSPRVVITAYADWHRAHAPALDEVMAFALDWPGAVFLLDTFGKTPEKDTGRRTLLDWLTRGEIERLCQRCHAGGLRIALAGSLSKVHLADLLPASPDWFAVRAAACHHGERQGAISAERVRELVDLLHKRPRARDAG